MKTFGKENIEWRDANGTTHVIVATKGSWEFLCRALSKDYVSWDSTLSPLAVVTENPSVEPVVWMHDRTKITCSGCLAVLDGAVVERVTVSS